MHEIILGLLLYTQDIGTMASHLQHLLGEITSSVVYPLAYDVAALYSLEITRRVLSVVWGDIRRVVAKTRRAAGSPKRAKPTGRQKKKKRARPKRRRGVDSASSNGRTDRRSNRSV